jgi:hypothetical protein
VYDGNQIGPLTCLVSSDSIGKIGKSREKRIASDLISSSSTFCDSWVTSLNHRLEGE